MKYFIAVVIILAVIYFVFKDRINTFLGIGKIAGAPGYISCKKVFFAKLPDGKFISLNSADIGTTSAPNVKYYKKDVTFTEDGLTAGTQAEITKAEFEGYCQYIYHPPYAWYTEGAQGGQSSGPNRTYHGGGMAMGGMMVGSGASSRTTNSSVCPSGTFRNPSTGQCADWSRLTRTRKTRNEILSSLGKSGIRAIGGSITSPATNETYKVLCATFGYEECCMAYSVDGNGNYNGMWQTDWICSL